MTATTIPFELAGFVIDTVEENEDHLVISAHSTATQAACPDCGMVAHGIHSAHHRQPHDLPSSGRRVRLHLRVPRFRCVNERCPRRTFVERIPDVVAFHAQRTHRLRETLKEVVWETGAEAGSRICQHLKMAASADTLLRITRAIPIEEQPTPRVLGVDDWAMKKGHHYGTILVDLERQQVVDLLPDREADTLTAWLQDHPGIEIICRDRASDYAKAATTGAPQAVQIADRWHLLKNLGEALQRMLNGQLATLRQAAKQVQATAVSAPLVTIPPVEPDSSASSPEAVLSEAGARRQRWFEDVHRLATQGYSKRAIARQLKLHRATVDRYLAADQVPHPPSSSPVSTVAPYDQQVMRRIVEDGYSIREVWQELQSQGFTGSYASVQRAVHRLTGKQDRRTHPPHPTPVLRPLSPRQAMWLLVRDSDQLSPDQEQYRAILCDLSPDIAVAYDLAQRFVGMFKQHQVEGLDDWLQDAQLATVPALRHFALNLRHDYAAVRASLTFDWSSGQVEGQVNRLKTIKRQMYGRANFDLLRLRVRLPP
jgi:transposase